MTGMLATSEIFGPTLQGEGPWQGMPAIFLRLARCNLSCSYCDTPYTWDWSRFDPKTEVVNRSVCDIAEAIVDIGGTSCRRLIITGGEPMLQQTALIELLDCPELNGWQIGVESNGTIYPQPEFMRRVDLMMISPHLPTNAGIMKGAIDAARLCEYVAYAHVQIKFVVGGVRDLAEADDVHRMIGEAAKCTAIWVMPEGVDASEITSGLKWLAPEALARGWHLSSRLHTLIWGDERGH